MSYNWNDSTKFMSEYFKKLWALAAENEFSVAVVATLTALGTTVMDYIFNQSTFGTANIVLLLVIITVFFNTYYGVRKNIMKAENYKAMALRYPINSKERRRAMSRARQHKFDPNKLKFVFFKCLTLLGYLFFVSELIKKGEGTILDFTVEILVRAPVAIFWYYEFKSIGENSCVVYGQKAPIFKIVELIFEPKINQFFRNRNKGTDKENQDY